jgi:hypothetical protein
MHKSVILAALIILPGCAAVDTAAAGVKRYCAAFTYQERAVIRDRVNEQVAPHRIVIDCAGVPR